MNSDQQKKQQEYDKQQARENQQRAYQQQQQYNQQQRISPEEAAKLQEENRQNQILHELLHKYAVPRSDIIEHGTIDSYINICKAFNLSDNRIQQFVRAVVTQPMYINRIIENYN